MHSQEEADLGHVYQPADAWASGATASRQLVSRKAAP